MTLHLIGTRFVRAAPSSTNMKLRFDKSTGRIPHRRISAMLAYVSFHPSPIINRPIFVNNFSTIRTRTRTALSLSSLDRPYKTKNNSLGYQHRQCTAALRQTASHEMDNIFPKESCNRGYAAAQQAVTLLAQRNKTWKRLAHIVELATSNDNNNDNDNDNEFSSQRSIADIGCDHGLLSIALASSGEFDQVTGIDVSEQALQNGAMAFHTKVKEVLRRYEDDGNRSDDNGDKIQFDLSLPVDFRFGDGLAPLDVGEADSICIAGMGVDTMLSILQSPTSGVHPKGKTRYLDHLQCECLLLQPPTSRPRKLMELYKEVQMMGFILANERIVKLKERWYITSQFDRSALDHGHGHLLPGHYLLKSPDADQRREYSNYVEHHLRWLDKDSGRNGELCEYDKEWRDANNSSVNNSRLTRIHPKDM